MTTPVIIDAIAAAVLLGFAIWGAQRGLFRSLTGLLSVIVALVGAGLIAGALAAPAARLAGPRVEEHIRGQVDEAMEVQSSQQVEMPELEMEEDDGFAIEDLLALMGLDEDVRESLLGDIQEKAVDTGVNVATAIVESVVQLKLPGLHLLNSLGGAVIGLAEGALLAFLAIWIARRLGISFETETVAQTHILHFFTTNTPLSALSFLR